MRIVPSVGLASGGVGDREPTPEELAAIEAEWPVIAAELELLDVELELLGRPASPLDARRLRRATRRVLAARVLVAAADGAGSAVA